MGQKISKRAKLIIISISILLHLAILISLLGPKYPQYLFVEKQEPNHENVDDKKDANYIVKNLISQGSDPVTVFMADEPDPPASPHEQPFQKQIQKNVAFPDNAEKNTEINDKYDEDQLNEKEEEKEEDDNGEEKEVIDEQEMPVEQEEITNLQEVPKTILENYHHVQQQKKSSGVKKTTQGKKLTLSDITKSFVQSITKERSQQSQSEPNPSIPLSLQRYQTKVFGLLQRSLNSIKKTLYAHEETITDALLSLTIDSKGKLLSVHLNPMPKEQIIKDWLITAAQEAGLFPPIPKSLSKKTITLHYPIKIETTKGFGSYSLMYGPNT